MKEKILLIDRLFEGLIIVDSTFFWLILEEISANSLERDWTSGAKKNEMKKR